jgi:hypothetical protein
MADQTFTTPFDPAALKVRVTRDRFGFLLDSDVAQLAACNRSRLWLLLVRCGACRFLAAAQDVAHLCRCVEAGGDHVRDVSFPADGWSGR